MTESADAYQQPDDGGQIQRSPLGPDGFPSQTPLPPGGSGLRVFFTNQGSDGTPDAETLPSVFVALQSQFGLKLEPKKAGVDVMVKDHMEETATPN